MLRLLVRTHLLPSLVGLALVLVSGSALAQYKAINLDSNLSGQAMHTDPLLKNAWGLAYAPTGPFWISDEASGWATLCHGPGNKQGSAVIVPPPPGPGPGAPREVVY